MTLVYVVGEVMLHAGGYFKPFHNKTRVSLLCENHKYIPAFPQIL